jgi:hypothetical protein
MSYYRFRWILENARERDAWIKESALDRYPAVRQLISGFQPYDHIFLDGRDEDWSWKKAILANLFERNGFPFECYDVPGAENDHFRAVMKELGRPVDAGDAEEYRDEEEESPRKKRRVVYHYEIDEFHPAIDFKRLATHPRPIRPCLIKEIVLSENRPYSVESP